MLPSGCFSCGEPGLLFLVVRRLLIAVLSLVAEQARSRALRIQYLWCSGLVAPWCVKSSQTRGRTVSPALAGEFLTTDHQGSPLNIFGRRFLRPMHFLFSIIGLNMYDEFILTLYVIIHVLRSLTIQLEAHPDEQTQTKKV